MLKQYPRIVFMGTPEFAVSSLKKLLEHNYHVIGVVTAPDKPAGRGKKIKESEVKRFAKSKNLYVLQPEKLKSPEFNRKLKELKPDLQIVVAFRMLPEMVWKLPPKGTINLHASLLPQYRGAAPINHAVMNGERKTGVTTFFIREEIDTGNILLQEEIDILPDDTAGDVHDKLMEKGASLIVKTVEGILNNSIKPKKQADLMSASQELKLAPKIFKDDCYINWNQPSVNIYNMIRGMSPYPGAFTEIYDAENNQLTLKIFKAALGNELPRNDNPGSISSDNKSFIKIAASDGYIFPEELQVAGKRKMSVHDFLRGFKGIDTYRCK
jgi:methionyl-tRNA formyltransferase